MQSWKDLACAVSEKGQRYFLLLLFKQGNVLIISLDHVQESNKLIYIHDLLDVVNNHMKFQLNCVQT